MVYHHIQFICATRISACQGLAIQPYKQHIPRNMHTVRVFRARHNIKTVFPGMRISMLKIRRSWDRLIFIMGIPILVRRHLYIETAKYWLVHSYLSALHNWHWGNHMIAPVPVTHIWWIWMRWNTNLSRTITKQKAKVCAFYEIYCISDNYCLAKAVWNTISMQRQPWQHRNLVVHTKVQNIHDSFQTTELERQW